MNKKEIKELKKALKYIPAFKDVKIKESWFLNWEKLEDEIKEKQKLLRKIKRERKLQPEVTTMNAITNEEKILRPGYKILLSADKKSIFYVKDW